MTTYFDVRLEKFRYVNIVVIFSKWVGSHGTKSQPGKIKKILHIKTTCQFPFRIGITNE
jgi:hypothetical protein